MAYSPQTWNNDDPATPLSAERLTHIEDGIEAADTAATAPVTWASVTGKPTTFAPIIGTTATTALAGNTTIPAAATWANLSGKPATVVALPATLGTAGQILVVNAGGTALEWADPA